jgi:hypothetical protein
MFAQRGAHRFNLQRSAAKAIFCIVAYRQPALQTCPPRSLRLSLSLSLSHSLARGMAIFSFYDFSVCSRSRRRWNTKKFRREKEKYHDCRERPLVRTNRPFYLRHKEAWKLGNNTPGKVVRQCLGSQSRTHENSALIAEEEKRKINFS